MSERTKLRSATVVKLSGKQFSELDSAQIGEMLETRISPLKAHKLLVKLVRNGDIMISEPAALSDWTYKAVVVEGTDLADMPGKKKPSVSLTQEQFDLLTPEGVSQLLEEYSTERRAVEILLAAIKSDCFMPAASHLVFLSNERIKIEGIVLPKVARTTPKRVPRTVTLKGVTFNGFRPTT